MCPDDSDSRLPMRTSCCPCGHATGAIHVGPSRREFLAAAGGLGLIGTALTGITWSASAAAELATPLKHRAPGREAPIHVSQTAAAPADQLA